MKNPFNKGPVSEADKRVAAVRADLQAAREQLAAIDAEEAVALEDSAKFAAWSSKRSPAATEVARLERLVCVTEDSAGASAAAEADAVARRETAAARKDALALAERLQTDGARLASEMLQLVKDCAKQSLAAKALNERLPPGEQPIPTADILARDTENEVRKDLKKKEVNLWVYAHDGTIVGDQSAVVTNDGISGKVHIIGGSIMQNCLKRTFHETQFNPAVVKDWPGSFFQTLRLPHLNRTGLLFDGARMIAEHVAELDIAAALSPSKRQPRSTQVELKPADATWPPAGVIGQAARNET